MCWCNGVQGLSRAGKHRTMLTRLQAVLNAKFKVGEWVAVVGAGGGLGHLAGWFISKPDTST